MSTRSGSSPLPASRYSAHPGSEGRISEPLQRDAGRDRQHDGTANCRSAQSVATAGGSDPQVHGEPSQLTRLELDDPGQWTSTVRVPS